MCRSPISFSEEHKHQLIKQLEADRGASRWWRPLPSELNRLCSSSFFFAVSLSLRPWVPAAAGAEPAPSGRSSSDERSGRRVEASRGERGCCRPVAGDVDEMDLVKWRGMSTASAAVGVERLDPRRVTRPPRRTSGYPAMAAGRHR